LARLRSSLQLARVASEAHRAAEIVDAQEVTQLVDQLDRRIGAALGRVRIRQAADMPRVLDGGPLEPIGDAEVGDVPLARDLGGAHHPTRPAIAKAARHENAMRAVEQFFTTGLLEGFGFDPTNVDAQPMLKSAVIERLVEALVGIFVADVL